MEQMRQEIAQIRETLAALAPQISSIREQVIQSAAMGMQQTTQLTQLSMQVESIKQDMILLRTWQDEIDKWRGSLDNIFILRREHDASAHEARIRAIEEWRLSLAQTSIQWRSDLEGRIQQVASDAVQHALEAKNDLIQAQLTEKQDTFDLMQWTRQHWLAIASFVIMCVLAGFALLNYLHALR